MDGRAVWLLLLCLSARRVKMCVSVVINCSTASRNAFDVVYVSYVSTIIA